MIIIKVCGFKVKDKWYEHEPEAVMVNYDYRILLNFSIETDHTIEARRPDLIVKDRRNRYCKIIDFAVPYDNRVDSKEAEKIEKYLNLARETKRQWNTQVKIIPVVVGVLGTSSRLLPKRLKDTGIETRIVDLQTSAILCSLEV